MLTACGGVDGASNNGGSPNKQPVAISLQADYVGMIPVLNGSSSIMMALLP